MTRGNYERAVQDFRRARREAGMQQLVSRLRGQSNDLLAYDVVVDGLQVVDTVERGLQEVSLEAVVGSVGRYQDFTRTFLPKKDSDEERWAGVKTAVLSMKGWPPIDLYQVGEVYFVRDGNHRVSVARQLGNTTISAYVTEIKTKVPLSLDDNPGRVIAKVEYARFLEATGLDKVRPEADLMMTVSGQFGHLQEQIQVHRLRLTSERGEAIEWEMAVASWYDDVYMPVVRLIREQNVQRSFPSLTEADFYVLVVTRLHELENVLGWEINTKTAVADLATSEKQEQGVLSRVAQAMVPEELEDGPEPGQWRKLRWQEADWQKMKWYKNRAIWQRWDRLFADYLVPVWGEESDWAVVDKAIAMARRERDRLIGVRVVPNEATAQQEALQAIKTEFLRRCAARDVPAHFVFEVATNPISGLVRQATWSDIVIISLTRPPGSQMIDRWQSFFAQFVRRCPRPILAIPDGSNSPMNRMLLLYDGSPKSEEALFVAAYLWLRWPNSLTVLTVETENTPASRLDEAKEYLQARGVMDVTYVLRQKPIADAVLETAVSYNSNFLIMGGFGMSLFSHLVLGSTVDHMLRDFKNPILICR
ncbi:MAG: universal stress protein [Chloroflexota bacterium]